MSEDDLSAETTETRLRSFDRSLPMTLLRAREAVMKEFIPSLREHDLSPQQWRTIRALEHSGDMEITELCERCHLLKPSMTRILQNLQARGLLERRAVANDKRRSTIHLTAHGRELFEKIAPDSIDRYQNITRQFGADKLEQLYDLLDELIASLDNL